jgi:N-acetylated-alpha-linked acidic dipeptidase
MADNQHDERTPLLVVIRTAPPRQRYPHSTLRKCCSTILALTLLITLTIFLLLMFMIPDCEDRRRHGHQKAPDICISKHPFFRNDDIPIQIQESFGYPELVDTLLSTPDENKTREWSYYYTSGSSLAGKNLTQAEWTRDKWVEFGVPQTDIVAYDIYVNYPLGHRLALLEKGKKINKTDGDVSAASSSWKVKYEASLKEDVLEDDPTTGSPDSISTFHGYSASGNVTAQYVYVNYGTYGDFEDLINANVSLKGKIALIKYGRIFRGLKVKRAQDLGMVGAIIYSDPGDDGKVSEENGNKTYPDGPARNPSSVQRGSAQFLCTSFSFIFLAYRL